MFKWFRRPIDNPRFRIVRVSNNNYNSDRFPYKFNIEEFCNEHWCYVSHAYDRWSAKNELSHYKRRQKPSKVVYEE